MTAFSGNVRPEGKHNKRIDRICILSIGLELACDGG